MPVINAGFADSKSVKGIFEIIAGMPNIIINRCAYEKLTASGIETLGERYLFFAADPEQDTGLIRQLNGIVDEAKEAEHYSVAFGDYANRNMAKSVQQIITAIIRILAYCFTALVSVVCLLNLYNSIRGRAAERSKETAILRSVGITEKQLNKMHDIESLMLLIRGYLIAAVFCAGMIAVLHHFMTGFFGTIRLPVPWLLSAGIAVFIGAAVFVITRLCSRSTDSAAIIEEIRRETV